MKHARKNKQESARPTANSNRGGERPSSTQAESSKFALAVNRMTPEQERQFTSALDLLLDELVRQSHEGREGP